MSARYLIKTDGGKILQTDGTSGILLSPNTLTSVSQTWTLKYDILNFVAKAWTFLYDITGTVAKAFLYLYDINGSPSSVLFSQEGTVTPTALNSEICFITKTDGPYHYACYIYVDNMASGDEIAIKVQVYDPTEGAWKSYDNEKKIKYSDIKSDEAVFIPFLPATRYRVCLKQTAGTLRSYNWQLFKN